ncbi:MAG: AAA family ATPase [Caldilineaceae bacterium]|nr:AAA family ATPase [Caldilineaceae bacterium]
MSEDARFIRTLRLRNLLSFGPDSGPIELGALNVLIGPNGSGKSNLIVAIDLLRASATDMVALLRTGGGTAEWLWKGTKTRPVAQLNATLSYPNSDVPLHHRISFTAVRQRFSLIEEVISNGHAQARDCGPELFSNRSENGYSDLFVPQTGSNGEKIDDAQPRQRRRVELTPNQSVLSQLRDPVQNPEITYLGDVYRQVKLYRDWDTGLNSVLRNPQPGDQPNDFLAEDAGNLGLVLDSMKHAGSTKDRQNEHLSKFSDTYNDSSVSVEGGTVQLFLREAGLHARVPATRLSDGTLRFLCLASILCNPAAPPLICIEEPGVGLHPDILPLVAEMLIEASQRTQIIVTTYSDILVDALSHIPEAVLVCEKESNTTSVRRLDQDRLRMWLKEYSLGDLWLSGQLGGNRW